MKRALVLTLLAAPALALAQTIPAPGAISFAPDALVGPHECLDPAATLSTTWNLGGATGLPVNVTGFGSFQIYASNKEPPAVTTTGGVRACFTGDDPEEAVFARQIAVDDEPTGNPQTVDLPIRTMIEATRGLSAEDFAARGCDSTALQTFFVCVEYRESSTLVGSAVGSVQFDGRIPLPPTSASAEPADGALIVRWTPAETGVNATEFFISAVRCDAPTIEECPFPPTEPVVSSGEGVGTEFRLRGLQNDVQYAVSVFARSEAETPSATAARALGRPREVDDFWDVYDREGGREEGGCATGRGGALAILAAGALLLRLRRRS